MDAINSTLTATRCVCSYLRRGDAVETSQTTKSSTNAMGRIWAAIKSRFLADDLSKEVVQALSFQPMDRDNVVVFALRLHQILQDDQEFSQVLSVLVTEIAPLPTADEVSLTPGDLEERNRQAFREIDHSTDDEGSFVGQVKWWEGRKGFGYLTREDGEDVLFRFPVRQSASLPLEEGQIVELPRSALSTGLIAFVRTSLDGQREMVYLEPALLATQLTDTMSDYWLGDRRQPTGEATLDASSPAQDIWASIRTRFQERPVAEAAAETLTKRPGDFFARLEYEIQVRKLLKADLSFAADLAVQLDDLYRVQAREVGPFRDSVQGTLLVNAGAGAIADHGGVAAGASGVAVGGSVLGDVLINAIKVVVNSEDGQRDAELALTEYLRFVASESEKVHLFPVGRISRRPLSLVDIYVPLQLQLRLPKDVQLADFLSRPQYPSAEPEGSTGDDAELRQASFLEALALHPSMVLLGKPGSGKSTIVSFVALTLARAGQGDKEALKALSEHWDFGPLLPVRVAIRRFAEYLAKVDSLGTAADLWGYIENDLRQAGLLPNTAALIQKMARMKGALFLFDGLDEVNQTDLRPRIVRAIDMFRLTAGKESRFLITARPYAWGTADPERGEYHLADLDSAQVDVYIRSWCRSTVRIGWHTQPEATRIETELKKVVRRSDLKPLIQVPLLLNMVASVYVTGGRFPSDRVDLYNSIVELLIAKWNHTSGSDRALLDALATPGLTLTHVRACLQETAFSSFLVGSSTASVADISEIELTRVLRKTLGESEPKAQIVLDYIEQRAGLLIGLGSREPDKHRRYAFSHRSLQEYLAACYLASSSTLAQEAVRYASSAPDYWHDVLVMAARVAGPDLGVAVAHRLVGHTDPEEWGQRKEIGSVECQRAILAGEQLVELGLDALRRDELNTKVCSDIAKWLRSALEQGDLVAARAAAAGDVLARLGDMRFSSEFWGLLDDSLLGFIKVEEGPFWMGSDPNQDDNSRPVEQPQHRVSLSTYFIGRSPVTVEQFRRFILDSGTRPSDGRSLQDLPNHPVRHVTWYEAMDYCRWLTETLEAAKNLPTQLDDLIHKERWRVVLPSEAESEKAFRSVDGRIFPWGNVFLPDRANTQEARLGDTSAVGCFAKGASPYGLWDACGNVWEWTRSLWGDNPKVPAFAYPVPTGGVSEDTTASSSVLRVMRGGSFNDGQWSDRSACRFRNVPDFSFRSLGFRLALSNRVQL